MEPFSTTCFLQAFADLQNRPSHAAMNFVSLTWRKLSRECPRLDWIVPRRERHSPRLSKAGNEDNKTLYTRLASIMYFQCAVAAEDINDSKWEDRLMISSQVKHSLLLPSDLQTQELNEPGLLSNNCHASHHATCIA